MFEHGQRVFKELKSLFEAETDVHKRKELFDYLFADKVEEVYQYYFLKEFIETPPKDLVDTN